MEKNRRDFLKIVSSSALATSILSLGVCYGRENPKQKDERITHKRRVEEAHSLIEKYGNCCTSVFAAYAPELGMEKTLAAKLTRGMPGIGSLGDVCGTVSGATLVIGLKTTNKNNIYDMQARHKTNETVREFVARFKKLHSSIKCCELLDRDISTSEKLEAAIKDNAFTKCIKYVESAVNILDDIFNNAVSITQ